jgi:hypothetical protein
MIALPQVVSAFFANLFEPRPTWNRSRYYPAFYPHGRGEDIGRLLTFRLEKVEIPILDIIGINTHE